MYDSDAIPGKDVPGGGVPESVVWMLITIADADR